MFKGEKMERVLEEKIEFGLLEQLHIILTCLIISWFNNGIVIQVLGARAIFLFSAFAVWFAISCFFERYFLWEFLMKSKWLLIFSVIILIYSINLYTMWNKQSYGALYVPIIYAIGVFFMNKKYNKQKKIILTYFFIECIVICFKSIYVLNFDPEYSRAITGGANVDTVYSLVISYTSTYAFVMLAIFFVNMRGHYEDKYKFLFYVFLVLAAITIYMANYATAVFLGVVFVVFSIISKKKWTMVFWISICVLAVVLLSPYISEFFLRISKWNISEHLQSKAYQVAMSLQGKKVNYNTFDIRMEYMKNAWKVFKEVPFLGTYGRVDMMRTYDHFLRDHNVWVDMLARYGVVRSAPLIMFYISWYKNITKDKAEFYKYSIFVVSMFCIVCGFFNPINKGVVQLVLFVIIPMSDVLFKEKKANEIELFKRKDFHIKLLEDKNAKDNS